MSKVQWEISNDEVTDRDTALRRLQEGTTGHVVCARDGACLQSYKEADGIYHCEIVFKTGSCCPPVFAAPEGVTGQELETLYDRFASGDDFSFVEKEWEPLMAVEYRHLPQCDVVHLPVYRAGDCGHGGVPARLDRLRRERMRHAQKERTCKPRAVCRF